MWSCALSLTLSGIWVWFSTAHFLHLLLVYLCKLKANARGDFPPRIIVCHLHCKRLLPGRPNRAVGVITTIETIWPGPSALACEQRVFHPGSLQQPSLLVYSTARLYILNQPCCIMYCVSIFVF